MKFKIIAVVITALLLILVAVFSLFLLSISLDNLRPEKASTAMVIWLVGQLLAVLMGGVLAWRISQRVMTKGSVVAVFLAVLGGAVLGALLSFLAVALTVFVMGKT